MRIFREFVWNCALTYLKQRADENILREHMIPEGSETLKSTTDIFHRLLDSLSNRQGMPNSIGDVRRLNPIYFGFDAKKTINSYNNSWQALYENIEKNASELNISSRMDKSNSHNYWVIFCKGSLSAANYIDGFETAEEFYKYVNDFDSNVNTRPALPFLMGHEIFGYGFALACDFLKEIGFTNYSKPDVHLTDIFSGLKLCDESPLNVFRTISLMASEVNETPYAVDKAFWLIGSGSLYRNNLKIRTDKHEFVRIVQDQWRLLSNPDSNEKYA
jgi:hypothetical protein